MAATVSSSRRSRSAKRGATIEGLGASVQPFSALDAAFKRANGFEADIALRQVTQAQCPAITFLGRLRDERARAPRLDIDKVSLRNGETLTGLVDRFGSRNIELLLVSDNGTVRNVSRDLKAGTDAKTFSITMQDREGAAGSQPQLLLAVASPRPLEALRTTRAIAADQFFPAVSSEAQRSGQVLGVTAQIFQAGSLNSLLQKRPITRILRSLSGVKSLALTSKAVAEIGLTLGAQKATRRFGF